MILYMRYVVLKDKLRHTEILKTLFEQTWISNRGHQKVVRTTPLKELGEIFYKEAEANRGNHLIAV